MTVCYKIKVGTTYSNAPEFYIPQVTYYKKSQVSAFHKFLYDTIFDRRSSSIGSGLIRTLDLTIPFSYIGVTVLVDNFPTQL